MYTGREICQGCSKPGSESPRNEKTALCKSCQNELRKSRAINFIAECEYIQIRQHYHAFQSLSSGNDPLGELMIGLLEILDNPYVDASGYQCIVHTQGDNCLWAKIPKKLLEPLRLFTDEMSAYIRKIKEEKEALPKMAKDVVQSEKDRIYNEGIERGRNLLFQLNNNEITPDQFIKPCRYNNP